MSKLYLAITIIERSRLPEVISLYRENHAEVNYIALGRGTAGNATLDLLGLSDTEKAVIFSVVTGEVARACRRELQNRIRIDVPGTGIAFTVPMSSIGGSGALSFFTDGQDYTREESGTMRDTDHELIIVIGNQGYSEMIMDAAKKGGAGGGTVIHAQGTGQEKAEKFLGITLASEKEIIFVVTKTDSRDAIMKSIIKEAGKDTPAKAIAFSLPVTDTAGLRLIEAE